MLGPRAAAPLLAAHPARSACGPPEQLLAQAWLHQGSAAWSFSFSLTDLGIPISKEGVAFCLLLKAILNRPFWGQAAYSTPEAGGFLMAELLPQVLVQTLDMD